MYVFVDMEWISNQHGNHWPTQLAAARVDAQWNTVVNTRITEEVAEFQKKVSAIRAECLRMMCEASVSADLQEIKEDLIDKLSERALFSVEEPEGTSIVIGTARAGHFSWRTENGFHDLDSVMPWLQTHPDYTITDEYATIKTAEQNKYELDSCRIYSSS